jgi:hypothetical protein
VVDDRLEVAVGEATGLGRQTQGPLDLVRPPSTADSVARRIFVRIRSAPEAAARMS